MAGVNPLSECGPFACVPMECYLNLLLLNGSERNSVIVDQDSDLPRVRVFRRDGFDG